MPIASTVTAIYTLVWSGDPSEIDCFCQLDPKTGIVSEIEFPDGLTVPRRDRIREYVTLTDGTEWPLCRRQGTLRVPAPHARHLSEPDEWDELDA